MVGPKSTDNHVAMYRNCWLLPRPWADGACCLMVDEIASEIGLGLVWAGGWRCGGPLRMANKLKAQSCYSSCSCEWPMPMCVPVVVLLVLCDDGGNTYRTHTDSQPNGCHSTLAHEQIM